MTHDPGERETQTAAADLANSLIYRDRYASIHLARLILAGDVMTVIRAAARSDPCERYPPGIGALGLIRRILAISRWRSAEDRVSASLRRRSRSLRLRCRR
jgi:hypothetical protein